MAESPANTTYSNPDRRWLKLGWNLHHWWLARGFRGQRFSKRLRNTVVGCVSSLLITGGIRAEPAADGSVVFEARDSLAITPDDDARVNATLETLRYTPETFEIRLSMMPGDRSGRAMVRFDSPSLGVDPATTAGVRDQAMLIWHVARGQNGQVLEAPAVLIVHSMHPKAAVATMLANGLAAEGVHAFVIRMPGFSPRQRVDLNQVLNTEGSDVKLPGLHPAVDAVLRAELAVREVRRARDAILALPNVQGKQVGLVGVSLGAFVSTVAAAMDGEFDPVFVFLGGADGLAAVNTGIFDARRLRNHLDRVGVDAKAREQRLSALAPGTVAHRLNPKKTWLISAKQDMVVRPDNAQTLADRIGLEPSHHVKLNAGHYTAVLYLPGALAMMAAIVKEDAVAEQTDTEAP